MTKQRTIRATVNTTTEATLVRNPTYWGGWTGDHAKAPEPAIIRQITEPAVRIQNLQANQVQVISSAPASELASLGKNASLKVYARPSHYYLQVKLNCKREPLNDVNLRAALYYAYPFQQVCSLVYGGYATPSLGWINAPMYGYDKEQAHVTAPVQDLTKAKEYLAKTKYAGGGLSLVCRVDNANANALKAMELYKVELAKLGVTLDVQPVVLNVMANDALQDNPPQDLFVDAVGAAWCDGCNALDSDTTSWNTISNLSYWSDPQVDSLVKQAYVAETNDKDKEIQLILQAQDIISQNYPVINCADLQLTPVASTKLHNFTGFKGGYPYMVFFYDVWLEQ